MRLTVLGGGGFRVPLVFRALLADSGHAAARVTELVLYDTEQSRLDAVRAVLMRQAEGRPDAPSVRCGTDLDEALRGADFVFSAIRVGGLAGRARDERVPLAEGVLGQETVGAGGVLYGLRTVPVARHLARRVAAVAPDAWVINFTNPAGMVTEAMAELLGDQVIGICDSPVGLCRRAARALGVHPERAGYDYVGLNHLGWLRRLTVDGRDRLPELLADAEALAGFEEGRLFGADWLATLGALPNEYLHPYYFQREAVAAARQESATRGEFLAAQQSRFYAEAPNSSDPLALWEGARQERERTYQAAAREASGGWQRDARDLEGGGYDQVALALLRAISRDERHTLILNVRNGAAVPGMDPDAVVEVPCRVDTDGAHPLPVGAVAPDQLGLMLSVKAVERATVEAAVHGSRRAALRALALHPLVDSVHTADRILAVSGEPVG